MIKERDYLKTLNLMSSEEKNSYFAELKDWKGVKLPTLSEVGEWGEEDSRTFDRGLVLISVMPRTHAFISVSYRVPIPRRLSEITAFCNLILQQAPADAADTASNNVSGDQSPVETSATKGVATRPSQSPISHSQGGAVDDSIRPDHYDQWFDRMSPELQKKAKSLGDLYTSMVYFRQMVEQIAADPKHSEADLSRVSHLAVNYEKKILSIHAQANAEWEVLQGKSVSDDVKREFIEEEKKADREIAKLEQGLSDDNNVEDVSVPALRQYILDHATLDMSDDTRAEVIRCANEIMDQKKALGKKVTAALDAVGIHIDR